MLHGILSSFSISGGDIGTLIWWFVGIIIALAIVYAIMRRVGATDGAYTVFYVACLVILLIIVLVFFFGGPRGTTSHVGDADVRITR